MSLGEYFRSLNNTPHRSSNYLVNRFKLKNNKKFKRYIPLYCFPPGIHQLSYYVTLPWYTPVILLYYSTLVYTSYPTMLLYPGIHQLSYYITLPWYTPDIILYYSTLVYTSYPTILLYPGIHQLSYYITLPRDIEREDPP